MSGFFLKEGRGTRVYNQHFINTRYPVMNRSCIKYTHNPASNRRDLSNRTLARSPDRNPTMTTVGEHNYIGEVCVAMKDEYIYPVCRVVKSLND